MNFNALQPQFSSSGFQQQAFSQPLFSQQPFQAFPTSQFQSTPFQAADYHQPQFQAQFQQSPFQQPQFQQFSQLGHGDKMDSHVHMTNGASPTTMPHQVHEEVKYERFDERQLQNLHIHQAKQDAQLATEVEKHSVPRAIIMDAAKGKPEPQIQNKQQLAAKNLLAEAPGGPQINRDLKPGTEVDNGAGAKYLVIQELGAGHFGSVFKVQRVLDGKV